MVQKHGVVPEVAKHVPEEDLERLRLKMHPGSKKKCNQGTPKVISSEDLLNEPEESFCDGSGCGACGRECRADIVITY